VLAADRLQELIGLAPPQQLRRHHVGVQNEPHKRPYRPLEPLSGAEGGEAWCERARRSARAAFTSGTSEAEGPGCARSPWARTGDATNLHEDDLERAPDQATESPPG
jgi:hypothetical protein